MNLEILDILCSGVQELPKDFGKLQNLVKFDAGGCFSSSRLLEILGQLPNLTTWDLNDSE